MTVNALPTVVINADGPTAICPGSSVILTASGAASYVWSPGGQTTAAITVTAAGTYSVVGTDASGCENSASQSVTVNALPTVVINADGPTAICPGSSVILTASGAASYVWSPGGQTTAAITVTAAGTYSVVGTDASGCENSASQSVTVNALPTVVINADGPTAICPGSSVILTASGAASYVWSPGGQTTAAITVTAAGTYSVVGTDASGCGIARAKRDGQCVADGGDQRGRADGDLPWQFGDPDGEWRGQLCVEPRRANDGGDHGDGGGDLQRGGDRRERVRE